MFKKVLTILAIYCFISITVSAYGIFSDQIEEILYSTPSELYGVGIGINASENGKGKDVGSSESNQSENTKAIKAQSTDKPYGKIQISVGVPDTKMENPIKLSGSLTEKQTKPNREDTRCLKFYEPYKTMPCDLTEMGLCELIRRRKINMKTMFAKGALSKYLAPIVVLALVLVLVVFMILRIKYPLLNEGGN